MHSTLLLLIANFAAVQSQQYFYYPQEFAYYPPQQQYYYHQQPQQFTRSQLPPQQQYFVHYFPQQQQQFAQVQQAQQPIFMRQQTVPQIPQQQQFAHPPIPQQPIIVSMEATPPSQPAVLLPKQTSPIQSRNGAPIATLNQLEFDLPPPPPAQFLPDEADKIRIAEILAEEHRAEEAKQRALQQQQLEQQKLNRQAQRRAFFQQQQQELALQQQQQQQLIQQQQQLIQQQQQQRLQQERQQQELLRQQRQKQIEQEEQRRRAELERKQTAEAEFSQDTASVSHLSPSKADPNKVFLNCCKKKKVNNKCESRCNFDILNKKILTQMFLGTDPCPQSNGLDLFTCAAQEADHSECCRKKQVHRTAAGEKCLAFCNLTPNAHFQADASYLPCWAVLNDVKGCFKDSIIINGETIRA